MSKDRDNEQDGDRTEKRVDERRVPRSQSRRLRGRSASALDVERRWLDSWADCLTPGWPENVHGANENEK